MILLCLGISCLVIALIADFLGFYKVKRAALNVVAAIFFLVWVIMVLSLITQLVMIR